MKEIGLLSIHVLSAVVTVFLLWAAIRGSKACRKRPFLLMVTGLGVVLATEPVSVLLQIAVLMEWVKLDLVFYLFSNTLRLAGLATFAVGFWQAMRFLAGTPAQTGGPGDSPNPPTQAPRRKVARASLILFILGFVTPIWIPFVWRNSGQFAAAGLIFFFLLSAAGTAALWLASIFCGFIAVRPRPYVLWWVIPILLLLAAAGVKWIVAVS